MRITAKRDAQETGLASVGASPRGYIINVDGNAVAQVYAQRDGFKFNWLGWKVLIYATDKQTKSQLITPKGQPNGWPLTDTGLATAKQIALDVVTRLYSK